MKLSIFNAIFFLLITQLSTYAQGPVLDSTVAISVGQMAQINVINNALSIPSGNAGVSQTYDYSALPAFNSSYQILGIDNLTSPYGTSYPTANATVSWSSFGSPYYHFLLSDTSYIYLGGGSAFSSFQYLDVYEQLRFPFGYNDTYTDTFVAVSNTGSYRAGNVTVSGDGYGDLLVPGQTFNNVLRVKRQLAYYDTVNNAPRLTEETYYEYYKPGIPHYILLHGFYTITTGTSNPVSGSQLFFNSGAMVSNSKSISTSNTLCYAVQEGKQWFVRVSDTRHYSSTLKLYNLQGQLMWEEAMQVSTEMIDKALPANFLPVGMYIMQFNNAEGRPVTLKWCKAE